VFDLVGPQVLSRAVCYFLPPGKATAFGNRAHPDGEDVLLGGPSIKSGHCAVNHGEDGALALTAREGCKVLVNGKELVPGEAMPLRHNDRLCLGSNYCFVVVHPAEAAGPPPEGGWPEVDWDMLNREVARAQVPSAAWKRKPGLRP
jgi:hypothetical protein